MGFTNNFSIFLQLYVNASGPTRQFWESESLMIIHMAASKKKSDASKALKKSFKKLA